MARSGGPGSFVFGEEERKEVFLGTGIGTSIRKMADIAEKVFDKKCNIGWGEIPYREKDTMKAVAVLDEEFMKLIEWMPKINVEEGIRKYKLIQ